MACNLTITVPDATAVVKDSQGNILATELIASGESKDIIVEANAMINVLKGDFTGEFDLSVQDQNGFYNDYESATIINTLSIAANPTLGALATVRIIGGSLAADAVPVNWAYSGDTISQDTGFYNEIMILYVSSTDIRIVNRLVDAPDVTAPLFAVAPASANIEETSFDITATLDENGTVYGYLLADGAAAPDTDAVIANAQDSFADVGSGGTLSFTGLVVDTNYDVYVVAEDAAGNKQASPVLVEVLTQSSVFDPATISTQYIHQKLDIATTNADPVTLATDSLTATPYNFDNVGTVNRSIQNSKECVVVSVGNYLQSVSNSLSSLFQNTFSGQIDLKLIDGNPTATRYIVNINSGTTSRFIIDLRTDGKVTITYTANSVSVFAQSASSVFADGAMADFKQLSWIVPSGGFMQMFLDNVEIPLNGSFNGNMSSVNMSLFSVGSNKLLLGAQTASNGIDGYLRQFTLQPVIYTSQNRIDLATL